MRLKLIFENIKHHLSLSCFIILTFFVIITSSVLAIEITLFTNHVSSDKYHRIHNDFDIVIKSNTGLSLKGTRGEENEFDNSYDRRIGFYNVTLLAQTKHSSSVVSVYEGTNEDFNLAFNFNPYLNSDGIALTRSYAEKYNLKIGDQLTLNIGENKITYNVVSIVDPTGLVAGEYAFITGNNIAKKYAFKNMYNVILLDIKDSADYQTIYKNIANAYGSYTVKDINDQDIIKTLAHSTLSEMMIIFCVLFVLIILILMNMLDQRLKRQENYFKIIDQRNYFLSNKLILYFVMVVLATILSIGFNHILFKILLKIYQCRVPYSVSFKSYLIALILPFIIIFLKAFVKLNKKVLKRKYYLLSTIILFIVCLRMY